MMNLVGPCGYGYGYGYGTNLNGASLERQRKNEFKPMFTGTEVAKEQGKNRNTTIALGTLATLGAVGAAIIFRKPIGNALAKIPGLKTIGAKIAQWGKKAYEFVQPLGAKAIKWVTGLFSKPKV